jgi:hypothetical protein
MAEPLVNNWHIRLEWSRRRDVVLSITGRTDTRQELEEFIRDLEVANSLLASAIEARSDATGTDAAEGESAASEGGDAQEGVVRDHE